MLLRKDRIGEHMSEQMLVSYCAPTLAGIKSGSLFSSSYRCQSDIYNFVRSMNQKLVSKGLRVIPLRCHKGRVLIYVYRPSKLADDLSHEAARQLLREAGYRGESPECCVLELIRRLEAGDGFPHEIGLFLSYPPEDVRGFIEHKGAGCKCVGCWKVYGDAKKAQTTFDRYKRCQDRYCLQWLQGRNIEELATADCY